MNRNALFQLSFFYFILASLFLILCVAHPLYAASPDTANPPKDSEVKDIPQTPPVTTVVSANRREVPLEKVSRAVTVITREQIERSGKVFVLDLLRGVPGIYVAQTGTFGRETHVFMRGINKESTLVVIDGVQINNMNQQIPALHHMTTVDIERIEIIRGAQSVLYGADATGGVIHIVTKADQKRGLHAEGEFQYGTHQTFYEEGKLFGGNDRSTFSLAGGRLDSDGLSLNDEYENNTARFHGNLKVTDNSDLDIAVHHYNSIVGIEDGVSSAAATRGAFIVDPNRNTRSGQQVVNAKYSIALKDWWQQYFRYSDFHDSSVAHDPRNGTTGADPEARPLTVNSNRHTFEYQSNFFIQDWDVLTAGYEFEYGDLISKSTSTYNPVVRNHGFFLQNESTFWEVWTVVGGIRFDEHEIYGFEASPLFSSGLWIEQTQTKVKGSFGKGFRAPTFNQLFFPNFGNPDLSPETSWNWDVGFEQYYLNKRGNFSTMYFNSKIKNLIENLTTAQNVGRASSEGVEFDHRIEVLKNLNFTTMYTYTHSIDRATKKRLSRVPRHQGKFGLTYEWKRFHFTGDWYWVGRREDVLTTKLVRLDEFMKLDLAVSYDLSKYAELYTRIENATNDKYYEADGFDMPHAGFYVGLKAKV